MSSFKCAILQIVLAVGLTGCNKNTAPTPGNNTISTGKELPVFSFTELAGFPRFKAEIINKGTFDNPVTFAGDIWMTNHSAFLLLQKEDGTEFGVIDKHASDDVLQIVNSLQKSNSYFFPDALTNGH
jgi:hypothetical protein